MPDPVRTPILPPRGWQYRRMDERRAEMLMRKNSLGQLVAEIVAGVVLGDILLKEPCGEAKRQRRIAHRVSFVLHPLNEAGVTAADRLLNGAYGLRAHYCNSPDEGAMANQVVCEALANAIQKRTIRTNPESAQHLDALIDTVGDSLAKLSAKLWFDVLTDKRPPSTEDGEVLSETWAQSRQDPEAVKRALSELSPQQIEWSLAKGWSVPRPWALDVKAAFTEPNGMEYLPLSKKRRSLQIHLMGWT